MTTYSETSLRLSRTAVAVALAVVAVAAPRWVAADLVVNESRTAGGVTYTVADDGAVAIAFAGLADGAQPVFMRGALVADQGVAGSPFHGNYAAAGYNTVSFRMTADATPAYARVVLRGAASGRVWSRYFQVEPTVGSWVTVSFALDLSGGWTRNDTDLAAQWDADIVDVGLIGIEIQKGGRAAQSYAIAGFELTGTGAGSGEAQLTPFELALRDRFGVTSLADLTDEQRRLQQYGMAEWERLLAEYDDEYYVNNLFLVRRVSYGEDGGAAIEWPAVRGFSYTIERLNMNAISEGFKLLPGGLGVGVVPEHGETGMTSYADATAEAGVNYAYRVRRQPNQE